MKTKAPPLAECKDHELSIAKKPKKHNAVLYRMDRLPDEILIAIISSLSLKDAVRTSVLSRRWRYLWHFTSGSLDLDLNQWNGNCVTCINANEFVSWVDQVVKLHQGPSVDKFVVRCHGMDQDTADIDRFWNWIRFAIEKGVRVFEFDIFPGFDFPDLDKFLSISRAGLVKKPKDYFGGGGSGGLSLLTSFTLNQLNIKDEMIEYLLSTCPHLEHLCVIFDKHLKNLNVVGPSLKSLVISFCSGLKTLTISAANLVSFEYGGIHSKRASDIQFENVPLLSKFKVRGSLCESLLFQPRRYSKYSHICNQLDSLFLHVNLLDIPIAPNFPDSLFGVTQWRCLKQLELVLHTVAGENLLFFVVLTMACPFLSKFVVTIWGAMACPFHFSTDTRANVPLILLYFWAAIILLKEKKPAPFYYDLLASKEEMVSGLHGYKQVEAARMAHHHQCLKVVKLIYFAGYRSDFRFALALLQIAKSLEKIIVSPGPGYFIHGCFEPERISIVRERAKQLETNLPHGAKLVIL